MIELLLYHQFTREVAVAVMKVPIALVVGAIQCSLLGFFSTTSMAADISGSARVVDGDTIDAVVDGRRERIRLIGIDTPETLKPDTPVECYGPEASARTEALLPASTPIRLERDIEPRDAFGRLLAYVYRATDGLFVNLHLVAGGFARPLPFEPNTAHADTLAGAAASARSQSLGLWAACSG